jgi:hypothetical protein
MNPNNKPNWFKRSIAIVIVALLALVVAHGFSDSKNLPSGISDKWQAVFLTDGQVYFGKLENYNGEYVLLDSVYYLKFASGLQEQNITSVSATSAQNLNLIKLGGEAHQPEGQMFIEKDKILFFENLKPTSPVVQAIEHNS